MTQSHNEVSHILVTPESTPAIEERYGRSKQRGVDKRAGWTLAGAAIAGGLVFLFFGGWQNSNQVEFRDISYSVESVREVTVDFEVSATPGTPVTCTLEALSPSYATVGWKVIELEPSENRTRRFHESLVTTYQSTTGVVRNCWIPEEPL